MAEEVSLDELARQIVAEQENLKRLRVEESLACQAVCSSSNRLNDLKKRLQRAADSTLVEKEKR